MSEQNIDNNEIQKYLENGYIIKKNLFSIEDSLRINDSLDKIPPKVFIPYADKVAWGFGDLRDNKVIEEILPLEKMFSLCKPFLKDGLMQCNHLMANNKEAFIGPDVEWHQEFYNIDTYAPGYSSNLDLSNFIQVFIALDEHTQENGPLLVFESSHKDGILKHEDIINMNLGHKRRVKFSELLKLKERRIMKKILLKPGDAVFFNHLIVHGSGTNTSPKRRRALLYQIRIDDKKKDEIKYIKDVKYRSNFIIEECRKIVQKLSKNDPYSEFKK